MDTPTSITRIGKYEILSELGRGGMGVVYRAEDKNIGREVAIKTLTDATPELRQRFLIEARSGVLNHPNIVTIYDFGEQDGNPYIVMEYLHGDTLEKVLHRTQPLTMVEILDIIRQVCLGLGYAHQKGVVHRDIKPANIMVLFEGPIKIVDFGIARLESASGHTQTGAVIGTFHYIAPERLKGEPSDGRSDIWAVGVMLYLMLTGVFPFAGEDISALHKVVNEPFEPLNNRIQDYPRALDQVVDRALAKKPDERYATAEEMAADIEAINEGLKRSRVGEMLGRVRKLFEQEELSAARPLLVDLQRLDPQNTEVKKLLREVQDKLSRQQKSEQVRQTMSSAEEAVLAQRFTDALELYRQAAKIDPENTDVTQKMEYVRVLKEKADKISLLERQAREARHRNDFGEASRLIDEALLVDDRNTSLRNEKARILQESERAAKEGTKRRLKDAGKDKLYGRAYTEAIQNLREALEIDPTDLEAQQMFQDATARQEEERRRKVVEQIVAEIQECLYRGELQRAADLTKRSLERLPTEAALLRLKTEVEKKLSEAVTQKLVEETSLTVQNLFFSAPQEALDVVQQALEKVPGEERLLALRERLVAQLKKVNLEALRAQYLKQAQAAMDAGKLDEAITVLESANLECGETSEVTYLIEHIRTEKQDRERREAVTQVLDRARKLIAEEDFEGAVALLQPVQQQTGNAAIEQLLLQAQESLAETKRRTATVLSRVESLKETDPDQALKLIDSQPASMQKLSEIKALRSQLVSRAEVHKATAEAIQRSAALLEKKDVRGGMETLEAVQKAYGSSPELTAAIAAYSQRRTALSTSIVQEASSAARQAILAKNPSLALDQLQQSSKVLEFAQPEAQADWKRLSDEVSKLTGKKVETQSAAAQPTKKSSLGLILGLVAVLLIVAGAGLFFLLKKPTVTAPPSFIQLNATPFAEVQSITDDKGHSVALPAGDHSTPLRIESIPEGTYTVVFKSGNGTVQKETCNLTLDHLCSTKFQEIGDSQVEEILAGQQ